MDLVNEYLHVYGIAGVRIGGLRLVAQNAQLHLLARASVQRQWIVTLVAAFGAHYIAYYGHLGSIGHEVEHVIRVLRTEIESGQVPGGIRSNTMSGRAIHARRRLGSEFVGVLAIANLRENPARLRAGLSGRNFGDRAGLYACGVGGELGLTGWKC